MNINTRILKVITKNERGSIFLEFTGCIIIIALLYLGMINIALRIEDSNSLPKVARDGARQAAMSGEIEEGYQRAEDTAWMLGLDEDKLNVDFDRYSFGSRELLDCEVEYESSPFSRMFPKLAGEEPMDEKKLHSKVTFGWWDHEKNN